MNAMNKNSYEEITTLNDAKDVFDLLKFLKYKYRLIKIAYRHNYLKLC